MNTKRGFTQVSILIVAVVLIVAVAGGYFLLQKSKMSPSSTTADQKMIQDQSQSDEAELNSVDIDASVDSGLTQIDSDVATF